MVPWHRYPDRTRDRHRCAARDGGRACFAVLLLAAAWPAAAQERPIGLDTVHVRAASRLAHAAQSGFRSVEIVDRAQLERMPAVTVAELLARVVGVDVLPRSAAQADMSIRGSTAEQVLILVDGVRVSDEQTAHFNLDLAVPLASIERIEVLRGPGAAVHGSDAVGGVVNIVTRRDRHASAAAGAGSFGSAAVGASYGHVDARSGFTLHAAGDYARSDGHRPGTDYDIVQARAAAAWPLASQRLLLDAGIGVRDFGAADFYAPFPSHERTSSATAAARVEHAATTGWRLTPQLSVRRHTDRFTLRRDDPAFYQNEHTSWQGAAELTARYDDGRGLAFAAGAEASGASLRSERLGDRTERRAALFSEATFGSVETAAVNVGVRADAGNSFDTFASPSVALSARPAAGVRVRASASRGFRAPTWTERYYEDPANIGDPDVRAERFTAGEVGANVNVVRGVVADVVVFRRAATDLIDWARPAAAADPGSTPWRTMNITRADFTGVEARIELPAVPYARVALRGMALSVDAAAADGFISKYALRTVTQHAGISVDAQPAAALTIGFDAAHARRAREGAFIRADARLGWMTAGIMLHLDVRNITDADYLDAAAEAVAGRSFLVGVRWSGRPPERAGRP